MKYETLKQTVYSIKTEHDLRKFLAVNGYSGEVINRWVDKWKENKESAEVQDLFAYNGIKDGNE
jgi:phosphoketolase